MGDNTGIYIYMCVCVDRALLRLTEVGGALKIPMRCLTRLTRDHVLSG